DLTIPAMNMENDFTWAFWAKQQGDGTGVNESILGNRYAADGSDPLEFIKFTPTKFEYYNNDPDYTVTIDYDDIPSDVWIHHAGVKDGTTLRYYRNGVEAGTSTITFTIRANPFYIGGALERWSGYLSDVRLYTKAMTENEIIAAIQGVGGLWPYASKPTPADGALYPDTWASMSWRPGGFAVSHDVYMGDNFDDVNDGTQDSDVFRGNQDLDVTYFVAGFPGFPYPDGLVPGTTYYWRIDEINEAEPNSPWKGNIWSFSIPPKTAYYPDPANDAELVDLNVQLSWTAGFDSRLHYIVFGEDFDEVNDAVQGTPNGTTRYNPGPLNLAKTYYWRVDEFDGAGTYKGEVWSFTTLGAASGANPANGAVDVKPSVVLSWDAGSVAASHEVYFGTDADAVKNATTTSPEYKGAKALGEESYDPGKLTFNSAYYWRIDEVNGVNPDSPWTGKVWSFTTGDFFVIDDFEDYDTGENQIWYAWHDGLGAGAPGTPGYFPGNGTGSAVGDETSPSYAEENIVHGGSKSMPVSYDNNKQGYAYYSEVEHALTDQRDWTEEGVTELSLWFYGDSANAAEPLYVAISNSAGAPAMVVHDDPAAATIDTWTQWVIPLQAFADQGISLTNVDMIAIGLGTQGNMTTPGGSGKMYIDDIRLIQPSTAPLE
ncbi:MAG: LamG domain-containing protein, partial [Sedimentisphaerales bacterium]